ncbi:MAG: hypothetical protein ABI439_02825 [Rhodospirillales bacterium]
MAPLSDRKARAERLGDYFELQLRFAAHMAERLALPFPTAVKRFTNLHRRFGLGDPNGGDPDHEQQPLWDAYADRLATMPTLAAQRAWTQEFFLTAPPDALPADQTFFGCFGCVPPEETGIVRIHFGKRDNDELSPLHRSKIEQRKADLARVVAFVNQRYPEATSIKGISWLYNLPAYRWLFPPDYAASVAPVKAVRLNGMSSWGQVLKNDETIKPELRNALLGNLPAMDIAAPWRSFPLPVMTAQAPLAAFSAFYRGHNVDELPAQL